MLGNGTKQTDVVATRMSANDPKRTCLLRNQQAKPREEQSSIGKIGAESDTEPEPDRVAALGGRTLIVPSSIQ